MTETTEPQAEAIFHPLKPAKTCAFEDAYVKQYLAKWDMLKNTKFLQFRYTKAYHKMASDEFLIDFFNDPNVQQALEVMQPKGGWMPAVGKVKAVKSSVVPGTLTRMDLFDKLGDAEPSILRGTSSIMKCMEEIVDGFTVSDTLREMLVKGDDSENCELFSEQDKAEFLFRVFKALCLGGSMNQYEDEIDPYLDVTKRIYKEMLSVQKDATTGKVAVASPVFAVTSLDTEDGWSLFPVASQNSFAFVTMDPARRTCKLWYHAFLPYW
mmetsp:Transcript_5539/g.14396  ORF Transcript_5539/g.14396 Transcript_5539/m.14396 type:complete len:267 (-) Transcript_5539:364-1164(-)